MSEEEMNLPATMASEGPSLMSVGAQLANVRETHGWSIEQVANQLNLAPRQVEAMERDDYAALPGMPIARGFIRAYAKLLRLDAAPLLAAVPGSLEKAGGGSGILAREALSTPFADTRLPSMADRPVISAKWYVLLIVLVVVLAGLWAQQQGMLRPVTEPIAAMLGKFSSGSNSVTPPMATVPPQQSTPMVDEAKTQEASPPQVMASLPAAENESTNSTPPANEPPVSAPASAESHLASVAPQPQSPTLVLNVHADSWVEIRRLDNTIVFSGLISAGKTQSLEIDGPASMVIGNAAGVEVSYRGSPLELKANTSNNVARLNLK